MQLVIAVPGKAPSQTEGATEALLRPVCGIPLLTRVLLTAIRAGADDVVLIWPQTVPSWIRTRALSSHLIRNVRVITLPPNEEFDPTKKPSWEGIERYLAPEFLWMPWNWVTIKRTLTALQSQSIATADWERPALLDFRVEGGTDRPQIEVRAPEGVAVVSSKTARAAERYLVKRAGKVSDGGYSSFNRSLCRPAVRWLSHTRITPNAVSFGGLFVALVSTIFFMHGFYWSDVVGALLFFLAGLFDEMDGMLARTKFMDSPFGCWLEGFVDGLTYLLLFCGIAVGLSRHHPRLGLWFGMALLVGTTLALIVTMRQRRHAAPAERPQEYLGNIYSLMARDSSNVISKIALPIQQFERRGVMIHYLVLFTVLHGLWVFFILATLGSHLTWTLALYFDRRFYRPGHELSHLPKVNSVEL